MIRARRDEIPVHRPVVVLAEREAVGRVVVAAFREGNQVSCIDEADVVGLR